MKTLRIISIVWLVTIIIAALSLVNNPKNVEPPATPLGLGIGLIPILIILGIIMTIFLFKTRRKYVYEWYPPSKI